MPVAFPIDALLPQILASLEVHPRLVLEAPPGAGKTTRVPPALLDAPWLDTQRIVMLEPRRVAARAAATFMAAQAGEAVGDGVGYRIRFEKRISARTRIEVVTEGILARMIQDDPTLEGVGALLFDEFHERHLAADLGLALALDVQAQLRNDLRIVVMSATLDGERLAEWLQAPRLSSEGRAYPVAVHYVPARRDEPAQAQVRRVVADALRAHAGDVLVFLPGQREIQQVLLGLQADLAGSAVEVLPLHGDLPVEQQSRVLQPGPAGQRRVVLATNVAESSVTLPGVRVVVDLGQAREPQFDPNSGFARLAVVPISQASADQRAGRAGRVAEGWAYRLWPQSQRLEAQRRPELAQVDLSGLALEMAAWGSSALRFPDPPPPGALAAAWDLLRDLGATQPGATGAVDHVTARGRAMLALGTHPRLAALLLAGRDDRARALACDLAALLEGRDPLRGGDSLALRWRALAAFRDNRPPADASRSGLAALDAAAKQWRRRLRLDALPPAQAEAHELGDLCAHAYPDRIGFQQAGDPRRYALSNGRGVRLFDDSSLRGEPWIVAVELRNDARDALLLRGAPVDESHLRDVFGDQFSTVDAAVWDAAKGALVPRREQRFRGIVLDSRPAGKVDPALAAEALTAAVRQLGLEVLPWTDATRQWRDRVLWLARAMPELALPEVSDTALLASLDAWLRPAFAGKTRLDALGEAAFADALRGRLDWGQQQRVDQYAPVRVVVPSGQDRRVDYAAEGGPALPVKLQELFGLADGPTIAGGRIALTLHLLSPAGRPLQITRDLRSFWSQTYPDVRKEMRIRYPRHPWPEDPWSATATHRAKPRGT